MSKILLIRKDDDPIDRMLPDTYQKLGYGTISVGSADEAEQYLAQADVTAVFVDLEAVHDCPTLEKIIKKAKPYKMVVLLGTDDKPELICHAFNNGADDYIRKPFNEQIFEARARYILARYNEVKHFQDTYIEEFLDTTPTKMVITDEMARIVFANAAFCNKYNIPKEDTFNRVLCDLLSCQKFQNDFEKCPKYCVGCKFYEYGKESDATGKRIVRKAFTYNQMRDGQPHERTMRVSLVPMKFGERQMKIIILEDITFEQNAINELTTTICNLRASHNNSEEEVKVSRELANYLQKINDKLQRDKQKRQLLFDNMASGFLLAEYKDGELYFREGNAKLSEITKTDLTKRYGRKFISGSDLYLDDFYHALLDAAKTGKPVAFNTTSPDKTIDYRVNIYEPEPGYVAAIINDITEVTKTHRENRERARQLQRLNIMLDDRNSELQKAIETKNKFISLIAHDLRNPLNAINGLSDLLTRRLGPSGDQRALDMAKVLHQSAKGAYELLDNLLIWARTQQNTIQFNPETLNLHSVASETINEIKVQAERKHIMLINSTEADDTVWADKLMLQTIIRNIVSNAIKFTNEGGLIVVASSQNADKTEITIEDNGVGMNQETIDKILGTIELNSTKGTSGETGTGMGLIISKEFILRHKGTLNIESTVGKGSTFTITLPSDKNLKEN